MTGTLSLMSLYVPPAGLSEPFASIINKHHVARLPYAPQRSCALLQRAYVVRPHCKWLEPDEMVGGRSRYCAHNHSTECDSLPGIVGALLGTRRARNAARGDLCRPLAWATKPQPHCELAYAAAPGRASRVATGPTRPTKLQGMNGCCACV